MAPNDPQCNWRISCAPPVAYVNKRIQQGRAGNANDAYSSDEQHSATNDGQP